MSKMMTLRDESLRPLIRELKKTKHRRLSPEEEQNLGIQMAKAKKVIDETASKCPITSRIISKYVDRMNEGTVKPSQIFARKPLYGFPSPESHRRTAQLVHQIRGIARNFNSLCLIERKLQQEFLKMQFRRVEYGIQQSIHRYRLRIHNLSQNLPLADSIRNEIEIALVKEIENVKEIQLRLYDSACNHGIPSIDFEHWWNSGQTSHNDQISRWLSLSHNLHARLTLARICGFLGTDPASFLLNQTIMRKANQEYLDARNRLINANMGLVITIAGKTASKSHIQLNERIQAGYIGLFKAAVKYDPSYSNKFGTYAGHWIKQSIQREVSNMSNAIRVPQHIAENARRVNKAITILENKGMPIHLENLAIASRLNLEEVKHVLRSREHPSSMDEVSDASPDGNQDMHSVYSDPEERTTEELVDIELLRKKFRKYCSLMPQNVQDFARIVYGIDSADGLPSMTREELAKHWKMTRERVIQIEKKLFEQLKVPELRKFLYLFNISVPEQA